MKEAGDSLDCGKPFPSPDPGLPSVGSIPTASAAFAASPALPSIVPLLCPTTCGATPEPSPTELPFSSSSRRRHVTAVQPECVPSLAESAESCVSTAWNVALRRCGMGVEDDLRRFSRRYCAERHRRESAPRRSLKLVTGSFVAHLVEMQPAEFGRLLACVAVEDSEVALALEAGKVVDKGVSTA